MPVFISYRHNDLEKAFAISRRLQNEGVTVYLDKLDQESQTTSDITALITKRIMQCTHLLAIASQTTVRSWWVPFEIGEATIVDRRIATFQIGQTDLPDYLRKWPVMNREAHLDLFIKAYKAERDGGTVRRLHEALGSSTRAPTADRFHKELKQSIRRGY